jgi:hypothetical protein
VTCRRVVAIEVGALFASASTGPPTTTPSLVETDGVIGIGSFDFQERSCCDSSTIATFNVRRR